MTSAQYYTFIDLHVSPRNEEQLVEWLGKNAATCVYRSTGHTDCHAQTRDVNNSSKLTGMQEHS